MTRGNGRVSHDQADTPWIVVVTDRPPPILWGHDQPQAERREALDWTALARLLGWTAAVIPLGKGGALPDIPPGARIVVLATTPERIAASSWRRFEARLASEPIMFIARATGDDTEHARWAGAWTDREHEGRALRWKGPGASCRWQSRTDLRADTVWAVPDAVVWATLDGAPLAVARPMGRGLAVTIGLHPSEARDRDGAATALLVHLLTRGLDRPVAWIDHARTLVLRMDDPGGAPRVHLEGWSYRTLAERDWARIGTVLRTRNARLSLAYVPGWVDDGDARRGRLRVGGRFVRRVPGRVHPSARVQYRARNGAGAWPQNHVSEYRGIRRLRHEGLAEVELHGYTHVHPDLAAWSRAADRYREVHWYREFGTRAADYLATLPRRAQPLMRGLELLRRTFDTVPTTLVFPGDERSEIALQLALELGFEQVGGPDLGLRDGARMLWASHVYAPYLDQPAEWWLDSGLPVVGYFHDRDVSLGGPAWLARSLDAWHAVGIERFIDYHELAAGLGLRLRFVADASSWRLAVARVSGPSLPRALPITFHWPGGRLPDRLTVEVEETRREIPVRRLDAGVGRILLPPA